MTEVGHVNPRKTLLIMLVLLFAGGLTIYANTAGLSVSFNKYRSIAATEVDGKVYLDLEDAAEKMHAIVVRNGSKVALHKPNVNLIPIFEQNTTRLYKGLTTTFWVHITVDGLELKVSELKLTLTSPYEEEVVLMRIDTSDPALQGGEFIQKVSDPVKYHFKYAAKYYLRLWLKPEGDDRFHLVGERALYVTS